MRQRSTLQSHQLLEESEARYNLLVNSVKDYAIFMLNQDGYITTWNPGAQRIKGYTPDEIINKHFSIFYTKEALQKTIRSMNWKLPKWRGGLKKKGGGLEKMALNFGRMWLFLLSTTITKN